MPPRAPATRLRLGLGGALLLASVVAPLAAAPMVWAQSPPVGQPQSSEAVALPALSVPQAREAAVRIMEAVRRGDANARFAQFTPELQAITSPTMIAATMRSQPRVLGYRLLSVRTGRQTSTVEVDLTTAAGARTIFLVINGKGQIVRYYVDRVDDPTSKVAEQFMRAVSTGHFISAQSFLSPEFQRDITPQALQATWQELQRQTGQFVKLGRVVEADSTPDMRLVLVNVEFNRFSENVFVILNTSNQITGLDFPEAVPSPAPVR